MAAPVREKHKGERALLRFLQRQGRLTAPDVARLEETLLKDGGSVHQLLEHEGIISESDLAKLLADTLRLPRVDLAAYPLDRDLTRVVKEALATKYAIVPLRLEERLIEVATANPLDLDALRAVEFALGRRAQTVVATRQEITEGLAHVYRLEESLDQFLQGVANPGEQLTITELKDQEINPRTASQDAALPPVVRLSEIILIQGVKAGASDIHIEPGSDIVAVRYRIDGVLEERFRLPKWVQNPLVSRFKVLARLDITERRVPQDGRIQVRYRDGVVDMRVSVLPAQHGEKVTMRILDSGRGVKALDSLGFSVADQQRFQEAIARPEGMILVTGPTGSGKSTTLYAALREIMSPNVNIVTIENPIEYQLAGITQVEVNVKQGLTFASVLRSTLRQDPDVILVGEIRDQETAQIAFQAAQTGHLVLATLHTNDAAATITRVLDLGIESYVIASSLNLIMAQRLIRRVCQACSAPYEPPDESRRLLRLDEFRREFRRGVGCASCRQSGYVGRTGVYEVLPISPAIAQLIEAGAGESAIRHQARAEGCSSLLDDALVKLGDGITTPEEVLRVIQVNENAPRCPSCQQEIEDRFAVCPHCSTVLHAACRGCGKNLDPAWVTCPYCGIAVTAEGGAVDAATPPPVEAPPTTRTLKALVVDDDPDLRRIVRVMIERSDLGLHVMTAQDGAEALSLADLERPDIVVLDVSMPGLDGFEVCRRLRSDPRTRTVPVLMLTARDSPESVTRGFEEGTDDYVVKPFRPEDLLARMRRMIARAYGPATGAKPRPAGVAA